MFSCTIIGIITETEIIIENWKWKVHFYYIALYSPFIISNSFISMDCRTFYRYFIIHTSSEEQRNQKIMKILKD